MDGLSKGGTTELHVNAQKNLTGSVHARCPDSKIGDRDAGTRLHIQNKLTKELIGIKPPLLLHTGYRFTGKLEGPDLDCKSLITH